MVNDTLKPLFGRITSKTDVKEGATVLLNELVQRMQASIDFAIANGARKSDLAAIQSEVDIWKVATTRFVEAILANTPDVRWADASIHFKATPWETTVPGAKPVKKG